MKTSSPHLKTSKPCNDELGTTLAALAQRIEQIQQTIPDGVRLVAVTKTFAAQTIREAYAVGLRDFGESRIQEAAFKQEQLRDLADIRWHLIGHLQSNKAKKALEMFHWIHTCDSLKLARRLDRLVAEASFPSPRLLLQVKPLPDPEKYGWTIPELLADLEELDACTNLSIEGLMTILPLNLSTDEALAAFESVRALAAKITRESDSHLPMKQLSMGMSGDYPLAIQAGATMVRLGRILFGDRSSTQ